GQVIRKILIFALPVVAFAVLVAGVPAQASTQDTTRSAASATVAPPQFSETHHSLRVDGQTVRFTATAGSLVLRNDKNQPTASMFFVAYTRNGVSDESERPVTFLYNGGPGSASVWLELGAFGPRRVVTNDNKATPP